jgi:hypothetical protein
LTVPNVTTKVGCEQKGTDDWEFTLGIGRKLRYRRVPEIVMPEGPVFAPANSALRTDFVFDAAPTTHRFPLTLTLPAGAQLHYQPALTTKEIEDGVVRPAWIVGGYVILAADGRTLGHIARPFAEDADGAKAWGTWEWNPATATLTKVFDPLWLASGDRRFPLWIDASIGHDAQGASFISGVIPDYRRAFGPWTMTEDGTITVANGDKIYLYLTGLSVTPVTLAIWDDDGASSKPATLLKDTAGATENSDGWVAQAPDSDLALSNGDGIYTGDNHDDDSLVYWYDTVASNYWYYESAAYSGGNVGSIGVATEWQNNYKVSSYAVYTRRSDRVAKQLQGEFVCRLHGGGGGGSPNRTLVRPTGRPTRWASLILTKETTVTLQEIEQLSFEQLKAQRDEAVEALKDEKPEVLAARYVKNRLDALMRDVKLSEQGKTITALQEGVEAMKAEMVRVTQQISSMEGERTALVADLESLRTSAREMAIADKAAIEALHQTVAQETARADRNKVEAFRNHQAVAQAANLLNETLAQQAVEAVDAGR